jgi:hypothetical protein
MNKLAFYSLIDLVVPISETVVGVVWFSDRFSSFECISNNFFMGKDIFIYKYRVIRERTIPVSSEVNKEIM